MAAIGTDLNRAAALLRAGKLVAIPTETVYGLAGNAFDPEAVAAIFRVKNRPFFDPLIVHVGTYRQALDLTEHMPVAAQKLAARFWPGPLTLLLKKKAVIPDLATAGLETAGIRLPDKEITRKLLDSLGFPLVAPSANPFGYISPTSPHHVNDQLGDKIDYILDGGECAVGIESTIVGFDHDETAVHRLGGVSIDALEAVAGPVKMTINAGSNPKAPGMLAAHYSPGTPLVVGDMAELISKHRDEKYGLLAYDKTYGATVEKVLAENGNLVTAAKNLFSHLRWLDAQQLAIILAEPVPDTGLGLAINDRLRRAAVKRI